MKKTILLLCFLTLQFANSQNINFIDINFKNFLLNSKIDYYQLNGTVTNIIYPNIDSDNNGEISQSEALLVTGISLYYTQIEDFTGLEFFTNLIRFESIYFPGNFNFPSLIKLEELYLGNGVTGVSSITNFNLSVHPKLKKVSCSINRSVNLDGLTDLKSLSLSGNFTQIDLSDNINLLELTLFSQQLNTIDLNTNTKLISLSFSCSIQNLDLSKNTNLEYVELSNNEMEILNLGTIKYIKRINLNNNLLQELNTDNLFNLQSLQVSNNNLTSLSIKNNSLNFGDNSEVLFDGNPNLETICCDANEIVYVQNICNQNDYTASVSECLPIPVEARPLTMFPNPVKDMLYLDCTDKINKVEVYGSNGLLIMSSDAVTDVVDMQSLQNGMYFLKVYRSNSVDDMKFVKG